MARSSLVAEDGRSWALTPLGRRLAWTAVAVLASWPWAVSYMIAYAPEGSGLDFEPPETVFWLYVVTAFVVAFTGWRAGGRARRAATALPRSGWWAACALLWASALHHLVIGWGVLWFLNVGFF